MDEVKAKTIEAIEERIQTIYEAIQEGDYHKATVIALDIATGLGLIYCLEKQKVLEDFITMFVQVLEYNVTQSLNIASFFKGDSVNIPTPLKH